MMPEVPVRIAIFGHTVRQNSLLLHCMKNQRITDTFHLRKDRDTRHARVRKPQKRLRRRQHARETGKS